MERRQFMALAGSAALGVMWPGRLGARRLTSDGMTVLVDPRIELFYVILLLSGFRGPEGFPAPVMTELDLPYLDSARERFGPFHRQPVVECYEAMARHGFWLGHPVTAMLHLTRPPLLEKRLPLDDLTVQMAGGRSELEAFFADTRRFAEDSSFMGWYEARRRDHQRMLAICREGMSRDYISDLTEYYGERRDRYTLILAPLAHPGGFGPLVRGRDGRYEAFAVIGPKSVEAGTPRFGTPGQMRDLLWHEFSHSHVNHLTDRHLDGFMAPVSRLLEPVRAEVERRVPWKIHVADWISEHVVRGVAVRLTYREIGRNEGDAALAREVESFPYVRDVATRLETYEADRSRYPTLASFYPELVSLFEDVARH